jgi:nitric oxide reductase activation protein
LRTVTREIHRRAVDAKLTVRYSPDVETASASRTTITLPTLNHPISDDDLQLHRYLALHEVGHHHRPEAFDLLEAAAKARISSKFHWVWNLLEDEAQEASMQKRWPGDKRTLEIGRGLHCYKMLREYAHQAEHGEPDDNTIKTTAAYVIALASRSWHSGIEGLVNAHIKVLGPKVEPLIRELESEGWVSRIEAGGTVSEVYDMSRDLFVRLWPEEETPPTSEEVQQNAAQNGEENQEDGEGEGSKAQQNSEGSSEEQGDPAPDGKFTIKWEDLTVSDHGEMTKDTGAELHIEYSDEAVRSGELQFYPDSEIRMAEPTHRNRHTVPEIDTGIGNQLRRYVQATNRATWETERYTGKLNRRALKRIVMGTEDRHRRVFQRRTDAEAINTAITVLVDCSGSMNSRSRIKQAAAAAGTLVDGFAKGLRIPVEVLGHTTGRGLEMYHIKNFNEHVDGETVAERLLGTRMAGNADGDALMFAAERLARRKEQRRIIIMIADGQPTDSYEYGDASQVLHLAVGEVAKMGLELYGIGIGYSDIERWIPNSKYIPDGEPVTPVLLETCQRFVLRNKGGAR